MSLLSDHLNQAGLLPWVATGVAVAYGVYVTLKSKKAHVNLEVQKDESKVVHSVDLEDLEEKTVFCRCWRSKKFPYCDGSHVKHNKTTGDNIGPLIIKRRD